MVTPFHPGGRGGTERLSTCRCQFQLVRGGGLNPRSLNAIHASLLMNEEEFYVGGLFSSASPLRVNKKVDDLIFFKMSTV